MTALLNKLSLAASAKWVLLLPAVCVAASGCTSDPAGTPVRLPAGSPGIGFDDLRYSTKLHRVLVPSGRSGRLNLVDPDTLSVTSIAGFSVTDSYSGGHDDGPTSVDEAGDSLYVTDRTNRMLFAADPIALTLTSNVPLGGPPDYVRFVAATNELWVTEPGAQQIEIFKLGPDGTPTADGSISTPNGPESLVIDNQRGRAYTHRWQKTTLAIDVNTRAIVAEWTNGCASSRGIVLDETRGWLFAGCNEGTAATLDVEHNGTIISTIDRGSGFDVIGYSPELGHLYLAGSTCACLVVLGVNATGQLSFLDRSDAPSSTHCVVPDDSGHAWVCDPDNGQVFRVDDTQPRTLP